jgi:hypothetical protein
MRRSFLKLPIRRLKGISISLWAFLFCLSKNAFYMPNNQISTPRKEETIMATRKSILFLFAILAIAVWVLGSAIQAGAETMNFKIYSYVIKGEYIPIGDVEGHTVILTVRRAFYAFENGEVALVSAVSTGDFVKSSGPFLNYITITFPDNSMMIVKGQGTRGGGAGGWKSEIIKGTDRFQGAKGTLKTKIKYLPIEKGEAGAKVYGEGTITYTLPPK